MALIRKNLNFLLLYISLSVPHILAAQTYPTYDQVSPIMTIDQERLFSDSAYGISFNKNFQQNVTALNEENRRIEKELSDEELSLTEKRKELSNEKFRELASIFNDKVTMIRRDQAQKLKNLNSALINAQRDFFARAKPIILDLMQERGISFILNDNAIFMSGAAGDITTSALERIDLVLGNNFSFDLK